MCGGEFDSEEAVHSIKLIEQAIKIADKKYSSVIRECNTNKETQFYNSTFNKKGKRLFGEFELCLQKHKINHIPSRRNYPQTNAKKDGSGLMRRKGISLNHLKNS